MGLARGVVIRPISVNIPKLGLPLAQISAKIQEYQTIKDTYDELSAMAPNALELEGDQALKQKYSQYVGKISESVAQSLSKGDAEAAARMMRAAKQQIAREWKQGGAAFALTQRADSYAKGLQEISERELGKDYTETNKRYDLAQFKSTLKPINFNLDAGTFSQIGKPQYSVYTDLLSESKRFAEDLGITKEAFIGYARDYANGVLDTQQFVHRTKVDRDKIQQRLNLFLSDDRVVKQMQIDQYVNNMDRKFYDNPDLMYSKAEEYLGKEIENQKTMKANFKSLSDADKLIILASQDLIVPSSGDLKTGHPDFDAAVTEFNKSLDNNITEAEALAGNMTKDVAEQIIFKNEVYAQQVDNFNNRFGIQDNAQLLKDTTSVDSKNNLAKLKNVYKELEKVVNITGPAEQVEVKINEQLNQATDSLRVVATGFDDFVANLPVDEEVKKSIGLDLANRPKNMSEEDLDDMISDIDDRYKVVSQLINIESNLLKSEDAKIKEIAAVTKLDIKSAKQLYDVLATSTEVQTHMLNLSVAIDEYSVISKQRDGYLNKVKDQIFPKLLETGESGKMSFEENKNIGGYDLNFKYTKFNFATPDEAQEFVSLLNQVEKKLNKGLDVSQLQNDDAYKKLLANYVNFTERGYPPLRDTTNVDTSSSAYTQRVNIAKSYFTDTEKLKGLIKTLNTVEIDGQNLTGEDVVTQLSTEYQITDEGVIGLSAMQDDILAALKSGLFTPFEENQMFNALEADNEIKDVLGEEYEIADIDLSSIDTKSIYVGVSELAIDKIQPYVKFTAKVGDTNKQFKALMPERQVKQFSELIMQQGVGKFTIDGNEQDLLDALRIKSQVDNNIEKFTRASMIDKHSSNGNKSNVFTTKSSIVDLNGNSMPINSKVLMSNKTSLNGVQGSLNIHKVPYSNTFRYYLTWQEDGSTTEQLLGYPASQQSADGTFNIYESANEYRNSFDDAYNGFIVYNYDNLINAARQQTYNATRFF